jgi:hypothetical protein
MTAAKVDVESNWVNLADDGLRANSTGPAESDGGPRFAAKNSGSVGFDSGDCEDANRMVTPTATDDDHVSSSIR